MKAHHNPFASRHVESIPYAPTGTDWGEIMKGIEDLKGRGAIVGPEGSGKTTMLEELRKRLMQDGYGVHLERLNLEKRKPSPSMLERLFDSQAPKKALLLDGAEQVPWLAWKMLLRKSKKAEIFIVTSHTPGLLPTLIQTQTSPELLQTLANQLLPPEDQMDMGQAINLFYNHGGNIRLVFRDLYDTWAAR